MFTEYILNIFYNSIGEVLELIIASSRLAEGTTLCPSTYYNRERETN